MGNGLTPIYQVSTITDVLNAENTQRQHGTQILIITIAQTAGQRWIWRKRKMCENLGIFKGKRKDGRGWAVGYLSLRVICTPDGAQRLGYMIQTPPDSRLYSEWYEVEPDSIGEFSGKKDKKGVMIFEGDILEHHVQGDILVNRGVVEWDDRDGRWAHRLNTMSPSFCMCNSSAIEVIGNIYDNPELMDKVTDDV